MKTINGRLALPVNVWLQAKGRECGLGLWPGLNAGPICHDSAADAEVTLLYK